MVCKAGSGLRGSSGMTVTVGETLRSMSAGISYDDGTISGILRGNVGMMAASTVSVIGRGFGTSR